VYRLPARWPTASGPSSTDTPRQHPQSRRGQAEHSPSCRRRPQNHRPSHPGPASAATPRQPSSSHPHNHHPNHRPNHPSPTPPGHAHTPPTNEPRSHSPAATEHPPATTQTTTTP
ncbi:hypothetical protein PTTG_27408, partial [Puccinia triticina 1-1 BBBD Race 1]